ncbi:MAG TPA: alpha/beta hydrolase-fold protein [Acidimicrobiales bacterium]
MLGRLAKRTVTLAAVATLTASVAALVPGAPAAGAAPPADPPVSAHGITVTGWSSAGTRTYEAALTTAAVYTPASAPDVTLRVRILFPAGYDPDRAAGYPALYLLHGGGGTYRDWTDSGDVVGAAQRSGYPGIVVMPEGGRSGWYVDWASNTRGGFRPLWETFHVDQLVRWVDANFNTDARPAGRAIAGLSMGGFGALSYAGRNPSVFGTVASFSGGTDIDATHDGNPSTPGNKDAAQIVDEALVLAGAAIVDQGFLWDPLLHYRLPGTTREQRLTQVFGPRSTWPSFNPQDLAENGGYAPFSGRLALYTGRDDSDFEIGRWNTALHDTLVAEGVAHRWCNLRGNHDWRYWRVHLEHFMTTLAGNPAPACPTTTWP